MNIDDILDVDKTLEERVEENEDLSYLLEEKAAMFKVNQFGYQVKQTLGMSFVIYALFIFAAAIYLAITGFQSINTAIIPYFTFGISGVALPTGHIINSLINKKYEIKKRFKLFSNSKKESEKIEQQLFSEMQLEKLKIRNSVLEKTMEQIRSNELNITDLSKYKNLNMSTFPKELEKVLKDKETIIKELEKKYNELDMLSIKQYLLNNLSKYVIRGQAALELFANSFMLGSIPLFAIFLMPIMLCNQLDITIPSFFGNIELGLLGLSLTAPTIYNIVKNRSEKNFYNKMNDLLGDNKIIKTFDGLPEQIIGINELISEKIMDICEMELKKEECERSLQTLGDKDEIEKIKESYMNTFSKDKEDNKETILEIEPDISINTCLEKQEKKKVKSLKKY